MNVCTHSYSLVWYAWSDWEAFIDWMALSGINLFLAMTGQEEVAYQVFEKLGLEDLQIREWFNGPALLTWSRGQNEYGSNIAGPLPRSWMKGQCFRRADLPKTGCGDAVVATWRWVAGGRDVDIRWQQVARLRYALQQKILNRTRSLGLSGQLPGFQGNVPIALKNLWNDTNMTDNNVGTAWMDALDPKYAPLADRWTSAVVDAFGTDHWWQLDGYFNGGTAPWLSRGAREKDGVRAKAETGVRAKDAPPGDLDDWFRRGVAAYTGLNRTDPEALWSFQGWAFVDWSTEAQAASLKSFVDAAPPGKFVVADMSVDGDGEWKMWANASFWGAPFVWTALHDFGGTDGMKGDLEHANAIPFEGPDNVWGTGFTPEGIDQNPVFYERGAAPRFVPGRGGAAAVAVGAMPRRVRTSPPRRRRGRVATAAVASPRRRRDLPTRGAAATSQRRPDGTSRRRRDFPTAAPTGPHGVAATSQRRRRRDLKARGAAATSWPAASPRLPTGGAAGTSRRRRNLTAPPRLPNGGLTGPHGAAATSQLRRRRSLTPRGAAATFRSRLPGRPRDPARAGSWPRRTSAPRPSPTSPSGRWTVRTRGMASRPTTRESSGPGAFW